MMLAAYCRPWATMRATFVHLNQDFTAALDNHHNLVDDRPKEGRLIMCLNFVLDDIPLRGGGGRGGFIEPLMHNGLLKGHLLNDPLPPSFAQEAIKGVTCGHHQ